MKHNLMSINIIKNLEFWILNTATLIKQDKQINKIVVMIINYYNFTSCKIEIVEATLLVINLNIFRLKNPVWDALSS